MANPTPKVYQAGAEIVARPVAGAAGSVLRTPSKSIVVQWTLAAGDTGVGVNVGGFVHKNMTFHSGSYGTSTVTLQGSNDSTDGLNGTWFPLHDNQGNAISAKVADAMFEIQDAPLWVAPVYAAGTGTSLTVQLQGQYY